MWFSTIYFLGVYATDVVQKDLLNAPEIGAEKCEDFIENRIKSDKKDFYNKTLYNHECIEEDNNHSEKGEHSR